LGDVPVDAAPWADCDVPRCEKRQLMILETRFSGARASVKARSYHAHMKFRLSLIATCLMFCACSGVPALPKTSSLVAVHAIDADGTPVAGAPEPEVVQLRSVETVAGTLHATMGNAAGAMPADKFNFAPTSSLVKGSEFKGVRTFAQQAKHLAANIYDFSSGVLGENPPVDTGKDDDGPDSVQTKEQVVAYVKGAFAYGHKALLSLTETNEMEQPQSGPRIGAGVWMMWHSMDHYGQMVEYPRMNGIVPPASRQP
jgi:hypothetical protein